MKRVTAEIRQGIKEHTMHLSDEDYIQVLREIIEWAENEVALMEYRMEQEYNPTME